MAMIKYSTPWKGKRYEAVKPDKAAAIQRALHNPPEDMTEEQADYLLHIEKIYFNNYRPGKEKPVDTSHLTHDGIEQGMTQALPTGDR